MTTNNFKDSHMTREMSKKLYYKRNKIFVIKINQYIKSINIHIDENVHFNPFLLFYSHDSFQNIRICNAT